MKLLVIGSNGQLGSELQELLRDRTDVTSLFVDRNELDITDEAAVDTFFSEHKPEYCINAAAYTNVEGAETDEGMARAVNARGPEYIATACARTGTLLFHISTDFVFDGKKSVPYTEGDEPHPLGVYGQTKYEGDLAVQARCPKSFIIRTSWLYSTYGKNFVKTILRLCAERESLPVVADQYGSPTYARDLAAALLQIIDICQEKKATDIPYGIYHYANDGEVTWFEFAYKIVEIAGLSCALQPIPSADFPSRVARPVYSALSSKKIQYTFGIGVPEWDESLAACILLLSDE
ncbi:MAG: dTDP-4-dehydrorhamnose reductase [Candidatus Uhrbacteria bacterium]|nr:dTDP-4-dehydrorhamnose reductase [Candidatus Uhrbacteria bacterium]